MRGIGLIVLAWLALSATVCRAQTTEICPDFERDCLLQISRQLSAGLSRQSLRDEVFFTTSVVLSKLGRLEEAQNDANEIGNVLTYSEVQGEIALAMAKRGRFSDAFEIANGISDARNRSARVAALEAVGVEQAKAGLIDEGFRTVSAISNPFRRSQAQAEIAIAVATTGDLPLALTTAARIGTGYWFSDDQSDFKIASGVVARTNDFDQYWFYEAMAEIARVQAENGDIVAALQTANAIPGLEGRSHALAKIAVVQAGNGAIDDALATSQRIEMAYGDQSVVIAIADGLAFRGQLEKSLDMARRIQKTYGDGKALQAVAMRLAAQGDFEKSTNVATEIINVNEQRNARSSIAMQLAQAGMLEQIAEVLEQVGEARLRFDTLLDICVWLAENEKMTDALALAEQLGGRGDLEELMVSIAFVRSRVGDLAGAIKIADAIDDDMFRAIALARVAEFGN